MYNNFFLHSCCAADAQQGAMRLPTDRYMLKLGRDSGTITYPTTSTARQKIYQPINVQRKTEGQRTLLICRRDILDLHSGTAK